jgi:hypothetical protein
MEIITNYSRNNNHFSKFSEFASSADEIIIVSPFLTNDISAILKKEILSKLRRITLVTNLGSSVIDLEQKINFIMSLKNSCNKKCKLVLRNDDRLHAKIYLFKNNGKLFSGIITSANLTMNGFNFNNECGIIISDYSKLQNIEKSILTNKNLIEIDDKTLFALRNEIKLLIDKKLVKQETQTKINISKYFNKRIVEEPTFWLKPIGERFDHVTEDWKFDEPVQELYFSKRQPKGVKIGDIIIAYGVGIRKILSYYKVTSDAEHLSEAILKKSPERKRWPWFVQSDNLSIKYAKVWYKHNLTLQNIVKEFQQNDISGILTVVGGKTLGAFERGLDKIRIRKEFAEFIIGKIEQNY